MRHFASIPSPDEERLGQLACKFRGNRQEAERQAIAKDYAQTVDRLIHSGRWRECPSPEDQLPDAWMPKAFFEYWLSEALPSQGDTALDERESVAKAAGLFRFRFFFDTGSGVCLWSDNDATRERFGYPVDLEQMPLPQTIRRRGSFLIAWYDTFMDWENSPAASRWWPREESAFKAAVQELLVLLREHLGPDFVLVDESGTAA
jgi:hypothetical protein